MTHTPLISIILSTYNGEWYIRESIDSILWQSFQDFEFIIINDASSDRVDDIIRYYQKQEPRIHYIKNKSNIWLTRSLNKGIKQVKWKYIARIDDDDIWSDIHKLEKQFAFMEKNPSYWICGTSIIQISQWWTETSKMIMRTSDQEIRNNLLQSNQFTHSSILIRKSILDNLWGYDPRYNGAEDYELWLRIWEVSKLHNLPDYCVKYRIHHASISQQKHIQQELLAFKIMLKNRKKYPYFCKATWLRVWYFVFNNIKKLLQILYK